MLNKYTPAQIVLIDMAAQYGLDKEPFDVRLQFGLEMLEHIKQGKDMTPYIEAADAPEMFAKSILTVQDILAGIPNGHYIGIDVATSGPQLLSVLGRCKTGMENTGVLSTSVVDFYTRILNKVDGMANFSRQLVKLITIPYVYGSEKAPSLHLDEQGMLSYVKAYSATVPAAAAFRNILLNAWNSNALSYSYVLPDAHVAHITVKRTIDFQGKFFDKSYTQALSVNEPKKVGMNLPADVTHGYDAYLVRELSGRCSYNPATMKYAIAAIKEALYQPESPQDDCSDVMADLEHCYGLFNMVSVRGLEELARGELGNLSKDYLLDLLDLAERILAYPIPFPVRTTHDEFGTLANHVARIQEVYNELLQETYQGCWIYRTIADIIGDEGIMKTQPAFDIDIYNQIKNAPYAIH